VPLLLRLAGEAGDPELRAAAARALADLEEPGDSSVDLLLLLDAEESAEVRGALYEAIANQSGAPVDRVLRAAASESDPTVRLQGFQSVAALLPSRSDERLAADFDLLALPELRDRARSGGSRASRIAALNALKAAATPGTTNALRDLALAAPPPIARSAQLALGRRGAGEP
jgi:hypothetical protein